jgi:hypothetical protein
MILTFLTINCKLFTTMWVMNSYQDREGERGGESVFPDFELSEEHTMNKTLKVKMIVTLILALSLLCLNLHITLAVR